MDNSISSILRLNSIKRLPNADIKWYDELTQFDPVLGIWTSCDPLAEKYHGISQYAFCNNNPTCFVDRDGREWTVWYEEGENIGYKWVDSDKSYDKDGNLLPGIYKQAIVFTKTGTDGITYTYGSSKNIGTSCATVYKEDGTIEFFAACTYPSDPLKYPTIPQGIYEAKVGLHRGIYEALRLSDIGTENFYDNSIELGDANIAHRERTTADGINIHRAGIENSSGNPKSIKPVSEGCLLIDINRWDNFMDIFLKDKNAVISVTVFR